MTVCKYFLQGSCYFGERCRYEHPRQNQVSGGYNQNYSNSYGNQRKWAPSGSGKAGYPLHSPGSYSVNNQNRFAALSNSNNSSNNRSNQGNRTTTAPQNIKDMTTEEIIDVVIQEMKLWDTQKIWPFSCFSYAKDGPCLQGFDDISPEELRKEAYEMQKANTFAAYQQKVTQLATEYSMKRKTLQSASAEVRQKLYAEISAHKTQSSNTGDRTTGTSVFGQSGFGTSGTTQSVFGNSSQPAQGLFGKGTAGQTAFSSAQPGQSVFGGSKPTQGAFASASTGQNPFGNTQQQSSVFGGNQSQTSTFGQAAKVGGSVFGGTPSQGVAGFTPSSITGSLWGQTTGGATGAATSGVTATQPPSGLFGKAGPAQTAPVASGLFGKPQASQPAAGATGLFGKPATGGTTGVFGGSSAGAGFGGQQQQTQQLPPESAIYLALDQLTAEEKCQFTAAKFELGKIPIRPPPREMIN